MAQLINLPNGQQASFPDTMSQEEISNVLRKQFPAPRSTTENLKRGAHRALGMVAQGVGDTVGLIANPVNAAINWATGEDNLTTDYGQFYRDLVGAPEAENAYERIADEIGAGISGGGGSLAAARQVAAKGGSEVARRVGTVLAESPMAEFLGGAGAGAAGQVAEELDAPAPVRLAAALAGGTVGGMAGLRADPRDIRVARRAFEESAPIRPTQVAEEVAEEAVTPNVELTPEGRLRITVNRAREDATPVQEPPMVDEAGLTRPEDIDPDELYFREDAAMRQAFDELPTGQSLITAPYTEDPAFHRFARVTPEGNRLFGTYNYDPETKQIKDFVINSTTRKGREGVEDQFDTMYGMDKGTKGAAGPRLIKEMAADLKAKHPEAEELLAFRKGGVRQAQGNQDYINVSLKNVKPTEPPKQTLAEVAEPTPLDTPTPRQTAEEIDIDSDDVVSRLTTALNAAGKSNVEQQKLYTKARAERLAKVAGIQKSTSGEEGLKAEMAQLQGEMPKVEFEGVREQFSEEEIDALFDRIKNDGRFDLFEKINARVGLAKLLDGSVPTKSELALLARVFPADFMKSALSKRGTKAKVMDFLGNAVNLPRSLMSSIDLSAAFRQGVFMVGRKEFWKSFGEMFKLFGSEKAFRAVLDDIYTRPSYTQMREGNLAISDLGYDLTSREEAFISRWAENLPLLGRGVKASERAYTGFLNKLRADVFDSILKNNPHLKDDPDKLRALGEYINNATGRGDLGSLNSSGPLLNGLFFSPRLIASRVNLLRPDYYVRLPPEVRREAIKDLIAFGTTASTVMGLAAIGGADVETDPRSSDFAKMRYGDTRYDVLGGFQQYIRLGAQLGTNEKKTLRGDIEELGKKYGSDTRLDVLLRFLQNKGSPIASYVYDYLRGKDAVGEPFDVVSSTASRFIPLFLQDLYEAVDGEGAEGAAKVAPAFFGVGVQTYDGGDGPKSDDPFDQEVYRLEGEFEEYVVSNAQNRELAAIGRKMTDEEFAKYKENSEAYTKEYINSLMEDGTWEQLSDEEKVIEIRETVKEMRKHAREELFNNTETEEEE